VEVATATVVAPPNASARPAGATIAKTPQFRAAPAALCSASASRAPV